MTLPRSQRHMGHRPAARRAGGPPVRNSAPTSRMCNRLGPEDIQPNVGAGSPFCQRKSRFIRKLTTGRELDRKNNKQGNSPTAPSGGETSHARPGTLNRHRCRKPSRHSRQPPVIRGHGRAGNADRGRPPRRPHCLASADARTDPAGNRERGRIVHPFGEPPPRPTPDIPEHLLPAGRPADGDPTRPVGRP